MPRASAVPGDDQCGHHSCPNPDWSHWVRDGWGEGTVLHPKIIFPEVTTWSQSSSFLHVWRGLYSLFKLLLKCFRCTFRHDRWMSQSFCFVLVFLPDTRNTQNPGFEEFSWRVFTCRIWLTSWIWHHDLCWRVLLIKAISGHCSNFGYDFQQDSEKNIAFLSPVAN